MNHAVYMSASELRLHTISDSARRICYPRMDAPNVDSRKMLGLKCGLVYLTFHHIGPQLIHFNKVMCFQFMRASLVLYIQKQSQCVK